MLEIELATKAKQDEILSIVNELSSNADVELSIIKSNKDAEGIFTTVTYKRKSDNTVYCISTLSGGISPYYETRTEVYFDKTGTEVEKTNVYTLSYDEDGELVSEV